MWIANLSNGAVVTESTPQLVKIATEEDMTPWKKLQLDLRATGLKITGLRLQKGDVTITALPQDQCDAYYQAYEKITLIQSKIKRQRQGIGNVIGDKVHILWLEESNDGMMYVNHEIRTLANSFVHTTLYPE